MVPRRHYTIPIARGGELRLAERTLVMGVLNVTPDSFSDGGQFLAAAAAVDAGLAMVAAGADLLDVGGESTRPGAAAVGAEEERARVLPVIRGLARQSTVPLSIDTYKAEVALAAVDEGAALINDVSGLRHEPQLAGVAARAGAALVLMHSRGRSTDMYAEATYRSPPDEVAAELAASIARAVDAGVPREAIVIDPGLGFSKRAPQSADVLANLDAPALVALDRPILVGPSRKSFLEAAIGPTPPASRDWATAAAVAAAIMLGAHIVRVHRVPELVQVSRVADLLRAHRR